MKDFNDNVLSGDGITGSFALFVVFIHFLYEAPINFLKLVFGNH